MNFKPLILKASALVLLTLIGLALYSYIHLSEKLEIPDAIEVNKGSTQKGIDAMHSISIDANLIDVVVLKFLGGAKSGNISTENATTRIELLRALAKGKQKSLVATIIPGETTEVFLRNLAKKESLDFQKLKEAYYKKTSQPEGMLYPETYNLAVSAKEDKIINDLLEISKKRYEELRSEYKVDKAEFDKKLIVASVVEKEAASKDEMPLVASVVYNRLKIGMPLQMDGTLNYGIYSHQKVTPQRIREDDTTYNTYKNKGLPEYPVCNPSKEALEAAFKPANTDYLYFMKNKEGRHNFSNSYTGHLSNINDVKKSNR